MSVSVLIDGRPLWDASSYRGIGTYLRCVLPELTSIADVSISALATADVDLPAGVSRVRVRRRMPGRFSSREHDLLLPREIRRSRSDIFHSPGLHPPRSCTVPWVQTVHDVIPLVFRHPDFDRSRTEWKQRLVPRIRRASAIIADSRHTADTLTTALEIDPERVHVAHLGVNPVFRKLSVTDPYCAPFLLYVGEFDPRKGYVEAFEIIARLADAGYPHTLKVAGRIVPWTETAIHEAVRQSRRPERIELLGYVSTEHLVRLYNEAAVVICTSRYEGFGLPAVEGMACGAPVVAFSNSALTEVVDGGGVLVADGDVTAFADVVARLIDDGDYRWTIKRSGLQKARAFSWRQCAETHAAVYRLVAAT